MKKKTIILYWHRWYNLTTKSHETFFRTFLSRKCESLSSLKHNYDMFFSDSTLITDTLLFWEKKMASSCHYMLFFFFLWRSSFPVLKQNWETNGTKCTCSCWGSGHAESYLWKEKQQQQISHCMRSLIKAGLMDCCAELHRRFTLLCPYPYSLSFLLCQNVIPLATPDNEGDHGQREENGDEDEDGQRVIWWVHPDLLIIGAVGEKVLVYLDHVALYQWVGPVAVHLPGLVLCAVSELVVFTGE